MSEFVMESSIVDQNLTTISNTILDVDYEKYVKLKGSEDGKNIIIQPEGDVDTIYMLENPSDYGMDLKTAFSFLKEDGKKIGISILCRFEDKKTLEEIKNSFKNFQ